MAGEAGGRFGRELTWLRRKAGIPQTELAKMALVSNRTISSYETGRSSPDRDTVSRLDEALSAGGALVQAWESMTDSRELPEEWKRFLDIEREAIEIKEFRNDVIPGVLQTPEYAEAIIRNTADLGDQELKKLVDSRVERLAALQEARLSFVLNEEVARKVVGTHTIHREQVGSIRGLVESRRIRLSIIPLFSPHHPSPGGSFRIFKLRDSRVVGHEEHRSGVHVVTGSAAHELGTVFGNLQAEALPTGQTEELLRTIEGELDG